MIVIFVNLVESCDIKISAATALSGYARWRWALMCHWSIMVVKRTPQGFQQVLVIEQAGQIADMGKLVDPTDLESVAAEAWEFESLYPHWIDLVAQLVEHSTFKKIETLIGNYYWKSSLIRWKLNGVRRWFDSILGDT